MDYTGLTDVLMIRMFERIIAVIVGPLAIYFGYKLFLLLPTQNDSKGKIELPGFSVVLAKVGPGIFFAAFGSILVYQSITHNIVIETPEFKVAGAVPLKSPTVQPAGNKTSGINRNIITPQEVEIVRQAAQMLNCIQAIAIEAEPGVRGEDTEEPMRLAKMALLETVWQEEKWGKQTDFVNNIIMGIGNIPDDLKEIYTTKLPGCPK